MRPESLEPFLVLVLVMNFYMLASLRLKGVIYAAAAQGVLLALIYPIAHQGVRPVLTAPAESTTDTFTIIRLAILMLGMIALKGYLIPQLLFRAVRLADIRWSVESLIGVLPTLLIGAVGTGLAIVFARTLPLREADTSTLIVPTALATVLTGFLILTTRRKALTQVLGYLVLENGIFIFGMLLVEAMPAMVEVGVLLDLFVGVFVMGIIIHHVSREFPAASSEHLVVLRE